MMGMVTYDGLNGASAQSCKTDRLTVWKVPCLSRQSIAGQILLVCRYSFVYSKKVHKKAKKEARIKLGYRRWESNLRRSRESQVSYPYSIAEIFKNLLIIVSNYMA